MASLLRLSFLSFLLCLFIAQPNAHASLLDNAGQNFASDKKPAVIDADVLNYDENTEVVTASGHVEITQGETVLLADKITYSKKTNTVTAEGDISLRQPDGNVFFGKTLTLKDDLKQGVINGFSARFVDKSLISAASAERKNENVAVLNNAVYSPCPVCDGEKSLLWQVKAKKATIDQKEQTVTYKNAWLEVKDVPVLYTPYLSHPTPGADRKSGILIPKYSSDRVFGTTLSVPYYYNISNDKDATITPTFTTEEDIILAGEYRQLVESGSYILKGSITNPKKRDENGNVIAGKRELRGHIEGKGDFSINDTWSWGFDGKRSSDDTYLRRYHFGDEDVLISTLNTTAIDNRNNFKVEAITFQGLRPTDDPSTTPLILPSINGHYETDAAANGSRFFADTNVLSLYRDQGIKSNRLSLTGGWMVPHITDSGHVFELKTSVRGDIYSVDNVPIDSSDPNSPTQNGFESRAIPQAELKWSLPLVNDLNKRQLFLEPTANFIVSPYGNNPNKIPNEDSQDVEFSDENIFDSNHFSGLDIIESGPRVNYGLRSKLYDPEYGDFGFLFGQSYRLKENNDFGINSGLNDKFSDYVGRLSYDYMDTLNLAYRFRLDKDSLAVNRTTVSAGLKLAPVTFAVDYVALNDSEISNTGLISQDNRESIIATTTVDLTEKWSISASGHRNLETSEWINAKSGILYKGDCVSTGISWSREFTRDRDIEPNTTISLQISLKNLGY